MSGPVTDEKEVPYISAVHYKNIGHLEAQLTLRSSWPYGKVTGQSLNKSKRQP